MGKKLLFILTILALTFTTFNVSLAETETDYTGQVVQVEGNSTLYYIASDGNRYIFPNEKTYKSWFADFDEVTTISKEELDNYPLTGNIRYRPGILLVKFIESPRVYAVSENGKIRWVKTERLAKKLYGNSWNLLIDDIPTILFPDYNIGEDVEEDGDFDPDEEINETESIDGNRGFALGHYKEYWKSKTSKCRAIPAQPQGKGQKAIPAVSARQCKVDLINEGQKDTTAPIISNINVSAGATTATITWDTDEDSNSKAEYADESLSTASTTDMVTEADLVTSHSIQLTGLTASTTYYFIVESADSNSNIATSTENTFITDGVDLDIISPNISDILWQISTSTAIVEWLTDEEADSLIEYATSTLSTATTTETVSDANYVLDRSLDLTGLTEYTTYYYILRSVDQAGNPTSTAENTFITTSDQ